MWDVRKCWHNYPFQVLFFLINYIISRCLWLICSAPLCWLASGATYLLKVFLLPSLPKPLSPEQYNYYVAELAFYLSLMFSQFTDIKRKVSQHCLGGTSLLPLNSPPQTLHILLYQNCFACFLYIFFFFFSFINFFGNVLTGLTLTSFSVTSVLVLASYQFLWHKG